MKAWHYKNALVSTVALALGTLMTAPTDVGAKGGHTEPSAGNNLSFPVIWAEGVPKALRGTYGLGNETLAGEYWYQWGTSAEEGKEPASCQADPDEVLFGDAYCNDLLVWEKNNAVDEDRLVATVMAANPADYEPMELARVYLQNEPLNDWQAYSEDGSAAPVVVEGIDWGDNLESVDWYTRSQVRTEVVLFKGLVPDIEYAMRHTSGWGINEVHGLSVPVATGQPELGPGDLATVYSHCARLTIQKLLVNREVLPEGALIWVPAEGWTETDPAGDDLIDDAIFNLSVHEGGDGPGYYSAEINVKGRIIYGYTWNVRKLNDGAGDYRITFSFDPTCGAETIPVNTFFVEGTTEILLPLEEELEAAAIEAAMSDRQVAQALVAAEESEPGGGAVGVLDFANNLTYMDVRILDRSGGGGGGSGGGGGGSGGGGGGGHSRK